MTWEELKQFLIGKTFLIGLTFIDQDKKVIEQYQTSGKVDELTDDGIFKFRRFDNSIFQLPYDTKTIREAKEGEYRERETGNIIVNPEYITTWEIVIHNTKNIENMKLKGYVPEE
ncbi:MAG: hypothetical protein IPP56_16585 [Bacteroidetes bacterium]|nr:hypothetical protein [Bacteroidota bacterium]MBK9801263.1 hypothetical protein [Bacteroidota bacterium]